MSLPGKQRAQWTAILSAALSDLERLLGSYGRTARGAEFIHSLPSLNQILTLLSYATA